MLQSDNAQDVQSSFCCPALLVSIFLLSGMSIRRAPTTRNTSISRNHDVLRITVVGAKTRRTLRTNNAQPSESEATDKVSAAVKANEI